MKQKSFTSLEQKAKAYDEAIKRAKSAIKECGNNQGRIAMIESIFPELKEFEDERIRKALIRFHKSTIDVDGIKGDDIIAWLEKQGEQKPFDYENANIQQKDFAPNDEEMRELLRTEYEKGRADAIAEMQKDWSKEDETNLTNTIIMLKEGASHHFTNFSIVPCVDWLKSLKDRYTWKPSDEQMASITCAVRKMKESACYDSELVSLLNDLKKLK